MCSRSSRNVLFLTAVQLLCFHASFTATLTSESPPEIVKSPGDQVVFKDENPLVLECEATGEPAPKYRWTKDGEDFDWENNPPITQEPGHGTLNFTQPTIKDEGIYQCFAYNDLGTATSNSVTVLKAELKNFEKQLDVPTVTAEEGKPFRLFCDAPTGWPKPSPSWVLQHKKRNKFFTIVNERMTVDSNGTLWISNVKRNDTSVDGFVYACKVDQNFYFRESFVIGNEIKLNVIESSETASRSPIVQLHATQKHETVVLGKTVELFCIYGGNPTPNVTGWLQNGSAVQTDSRVKIRNHGTSLLISNAKIEDRATYTCSVSNGIDPTQHHDIELDVLVSPYFVVTPEIVVKSAGETAVIKCVADGHPEPKIEWIHNGRPLSEATPNPRRIASAESITIAELTKNDTGNYGCNATNGVGYVYKDVYVKVLTLAPRITEPLRNLKTVDGKSVTIECKNDGVPKPRVKWTKNDTELSGERYSTTDSGDLQIRNVELSDGGYYTCLTINDYGSVNASGELTVKERTRIIVKPDDSTVLVGSTSTFNCNVTTDPSMEFNIEWLANDEPIDFDSESRFTKTENDLTVTMTTKEDSGYYTCVVSTELDNVTASGTLTVKERTQFTVEPEDRIVLVGSTATFYCNATADPSLKLDIEWLANNEHIDFDNPSRFDKSENNLIITNTTKEDSANYTCVAKTELDNVTASAKLTVKEPTQITIRPENSIVLVGSTSNFYCNVTTDPLTEFNIEWLANDELIDFDSQSRFTKTDNNVTITMTAKEDAGNYTCVVKTELENVSAIGTLDVKEQTQLTTKPEDYTVLVGSTATFYCNATTDPTSHLNIEWLANNEPIDFDSQSQFTKTENILTITMTTIEDSGNYTCVVKTELDNVTATGKLTVKERTQFTVEPEDSTVFVGSTATFYCNAITDPSLKLDIEWLANDEPIDFDNQSRFENSETVLIITMTTIEDSGNYTCVAKTELDNVTASAKLTVKEPTQITIKPENSIVLVGSTATFYCNATTDPSLHLNVEWLAANDEPIDFDSQPRFTKTDNNLTITMTTVEDSGNYTCVAKTELGNVTAFGKLNVKERTRITAKPEDSAVLAGSTVTFYCSGTSDPSLHLNIEWLANGETINFENRPRFNKTDGILTITMAAEEDSGNYTCVAKTELDEVTDCAKLTVNEHTQIIVEPEDSTILAGTTWTFYCNVTTDSPTKFYIEWSANGGPINIDESRPRFSITDENLTITNTTKEDSGNYTCMVETEIENVTAVGQLIVKERTQIVAKPQDSTVLVGMTATFHCNATTDPSSRLDVEWLADGKTIDFDGQSRISKTDGILSISAAAKEDSGNYTCVAKTELDNVTAWGELTVKERIRIAVKPEDSTVVVGSTVTFYCNVTTDLSTKVDIEWSAKGEPINFANQSRFTKTDNSLTITTTAATDSGIYKCTAVTDLENVPASAVLIVQDIPSAPRVLEVTCKERNATIAWQQDEDNRRPVGHYSVECNSSFASGIWSVTTADDVPASERTYTIPLRPGTSSTFRVLAKNHVGESDQSALPSTVCTTRPDVPYRNPDNVTTTEREPSTLVVGWTPLPEYEHNAPGLQYYVHWKLNDSSKDWITNITNNTSEFVLSNLRPNHLYRVKVVASNEKGNCTESQIEITGFSGGDGKKDPILHIIIVSCQAMFVVIVMIVCILKRRKTGKYHVRENLNKKHDNQKDQSAHRLIGQNGTVHCNGKSAESDALSIEEFEDINLEAMSDSCSFNGVYGKNGALTSSTARHAENA